MDETKRSNQGYEIIESCTVGRKELVIGPHPTAPNEKKQRKDNNDGR